jgi:hypothetical protein
MAAAANQKNAKVNILRGGAPAKDEPKEMETKFREGDTCLQSECSRAAAAMFRSTLEKTFSAGATKSTDGAGRRFHESIRGPVRLQG